MLSSQFLGFWYPSVTSVTPIAILASAAALFCRQRSKVKASTPSLLHSTWDDSDRLLRDLDWGPTLTYQQTSKNYLILYRWKEVLACADSIKANMDQLLTLLNLLLISQKSTDSLLQQDQVTQAPILTHIHRNF
jgi:hypothetical protein